MCSPPAICSFLMSCSDMLTADITTRLMLPLDSALAMLSKYSHTIYSTLSFPSLSPPPPPRVYRLPLLVKVHGVQIKACGAMLRLRLYQTFSHLSPTAYEGVYIRNTSLRGNTLKGHFMGFLFLYSGYMSKMKTHKAVPKIFCSQWVRVKNKPTKLFFLFLVGACQK